MYILAYQDVPHSRRSSCSTSMPQRLTFRPLIQVPLPSSSTFSSQARRRHSRHPVSPTPSPSMWKLRKSDKSTSPLSAKKKGNLTLRNYNSRALVHTSLDHEYLRSQFASVYGLAVSLPPSKYLPHPDEREIWFVFNILDFSGEQWRGFKGLVYFQGLVGPASRTIPIDYLDFGHLTKANINASSITVNPGCVVKNAPEGLRIYYASAGQQE